MATHRKKTDSNFSKAKALGIIDNFYKNKPVLKVNEETYFDGTLLNQRWVNDRIKYINAASGNIITTKFYWNFIKNIFEKQ